MFNYWQFLWSHMHFIFLESFVSFVFWRWGASMTMSFLLSWQHTDDKEDGMEVEEGEMGEEEAPASWYVTHAQKNSTPRMELLTSIVGALFSSIPIDYNLYRKFWTLQDYFRNPVQCYDKVSWMTFLKVRNCGSYPLEASHGRRWTWNTQTWFLPQYSDETLAVFKSFKLDDMQASKRKLEELRASGGEHVYFAKFLTNEKVTPSIHWLT